MSFHIRLCLTTSYTRIALKDQENYTFKENDAAMECPNLKTQFVTMFVFLKICLMIN